MSVNKNKPTGEAPMAVEPDRELSGSQARAEPADAGAEQLVVLDDLAPSVAAARSLGSGDLKLLRALQSVLQKRQADAWIDELRTQISAELEWGET